MKVHPFIAAAVLALLGATAFGANLVVQHRLERERRLAPPPPLPDEPPPPPRRAVFVPPPPRRAPPVVREVPPPTGELRVRVVGPLGVQLRDAEVIALRQGDPDEVRYELAAENHDEENDDEEDEDGVDRGAAQTSGLLTATELELGRYDLTVSATGLRTVNLTGVPTGPNVVTVALARAPVLRGALGSLPAGVGDPNVCGGGVIRVAGAPDADGEVETTQGSVDEDCSFTIENLPQRGPLTVELGGRRRGPRALVTLPAAVDPAFVCLAPPCAEPPASLAVLVADAEGRQVDEVSLEWTLVGDETHGELGTTVGGGLTYLHGRHPGETLSLVATTSDRSATTTVVVGSGVTEVLMKLPPEAPEAPLGRPRATVRRIVIRE